MIFQKLTKVDIAAHAGSQRRGARPEYVEFIKNLRRGEGGKVDVASARTSRQTVKNRVDRAVGELGKKIKYIRSSADSVVFEIVE